MPWMQFLPLASSKGDGTAMWLVSEWHVFESPEEWNASTLVTFQ